MIIVRSPKNASAFSMSDCTVRRRTSFAGIPGKTSVDSVGFKMDWVRVLQVYAKAQTTGTMLRRQPASGKELGAKCVLEVD